MKERDPLMKDPSSTSVSQRTQIWDRFQSSVLLACYTFITASLDLLHDASIRIVHSKNDSSHQQRKYITAIIALQQQEEILKLRPRMGKVQPHAAPKGIQHGPESLFGPLNPPQPFIFAHPMQRCPHKPLHGMFCTVTVHLILPHLVWF